MEDRDSVGAEAAHDQVRGQHLAFCRGLPEILVQHFFLLCTFLSHANDLWKSGKDSPSDRASWPDTIRHSATLDNSSDVLTFEFFRIFSIVY